MSRPHLPAAAPAPRPTRPHGVRVFRRPALVLALLATAACGGKKVETIEIQTEPVERRDIVVDASATGVVEPINVVEVKSKASGQITRMPVETGTLVNPGDLLVQLDTRDVQNQYDQSLADVRAAQARLDVSQAQKKRADDLHEQRIITAQEHETAQLDFANSQAALVRARTNLDLAQQRLEDATVRAPVAGTVIEKTVSLGQVITSATGAFGGGTTLLKMADLNQVRVRALVNETDIGNVRAGQAATVTVDAFPDRPFRGTVEKIEPQAVVQQNVTMFPVLVSLSNLEGLLKPGMNGEVSVLIDRRAEVLTVPNDAVRSMREAAQVAPMLGLDPDSVRAQIQAQMASMGGGMRGGAPGGAPGAGAQRTSQGEVALAMAEPQQGAPAQGTAPQGGRPQMVQVTPEQCAAVTAAFAKNPDAERKLNALRERMRGGQATPESIREESQTLYASLGVDGRVANACRMRARVQSGDAPVLEARAAQGGASAPVPAGELPGRGARTRPGLVFVAANGGYAPRMVRLGVSNFDYTEVVSGLQEGERVALLGAVAMQQRRQEQTDRFRGMTGGGVPGMQRQGAGAPGGAPGGGGGGAPRGGGGGQRP